MFNAICGDGIGMGWMVIIGYRYSKSTFGANHNNKMCKKWNLKYLQNDGEVLCLACGVLCTRAQTLQRLNAVCHNPPTSSNKQLWVIQNNKRKLRRGLELWISKQGRRHLLQGENSSSTASELSWNLNQKTARCDTIIIVALSEARPYQLGSHPHDHSYRFTRSEFNIQRCGWYKIEKDQ